LQRIEATELSHSQAQGFLLELGRLYGYETFTPDRAQRFADVRLGEVATLQRMPAFTYPRIVKNVARIDVIWFQGQTDELTPRYACEVEHSTGVAPGLLRLFQLFKARGTETKLFVVLPDRIRSQFENQVDKEPYRTIRQHLLRRTYTQLTTLHDLALRHAPLKREFLTE